ncbi:MAG: HEAT repeat domain-containing protein [Terracidiphilus sp.]|jgi:HEAT repeat protein
MSRKPSSRASSSASTSRGFDKELAELEALNEVIKSGAKADAAQVEYLRKFLGHRNNFIVSKAAKLVADAELFALLPDALAAFDRFFVDAAKTDPKCWAKDALAKTLVKLEHRQKDAYLRGLRHRQLEASWGPPVDSATALRGTCAHALVDCPGISDADLLTILLEPLTDADKTVRMEAARAIAQVGGVSAALILRLRALLGNDQPEVLGAVYSALLSLEGTQAIPLVAGYLKEGGDLAAEAAFALADLRSPEALAALIERLRAGADSWFTAVLLSAIALTRLPAGIDFLLALIARDAREAPLAIEAIGRTAPNAEVRARVQQAVEQTGSQRLEQALRQHLPAPPDAD